MRPFRFVSWAVAAAMVAHAFATYGALPERIATHFGFDGRADGFADKSPWQWALLPAVAVGLQLLFEFLSWAMPRDPGMINIPDKERFLRLPRAYQAAAVLEVQRMLDVTALGVTLLFLAIQWQMVRASAGTGRVAGTSVWLLLAPFGLTMGILLMVTRVTAAVDREERRWKEAGSPPE